MVLPRSAMSKTGFVNIIKVKNGFQARLQVPGDGRGGTRKRKQVPLPGLFEEAEDAAVFLASFKRGYEERGLTAAEAADLLEPVDKKHKPRKPKQPAVSPSPAIPVSWEPPVTGHAMPIPFLMQHAPLVAATPLPMQSLRYTPPFC